MSGTKTMKTHEISSLLIYSIDTFYIKDNQLWSSPIASSSIRLFADNFERVGIVALLANGDPDITKHVQWPPQYKLHPIPFAKGFRQRIFQAIHVLRMVRRLSLEYAITYIRMFSYDVLPASLYYSLFKKSSWFMSLHGDIEEATQLSNKNKIRRYLETKSMGWLARFICKKPEILFVAGPALGEKYASKRHESCPPFIDSGVRESDIYRERVDTCQASPYRLVFVGDLSKRKGVDVLVRAIKILQDRDITTKLNLLGSGDREWILKLARELKVDDMLSFIGFLKYGRELFHFMRDSDILVVPSRGTEGWARVITEANSQGLPIVVSDVNSLGITVREWSCGKVVPPEDPDQLAQAIQSIIESPLERKIMIKNSLDRGQYYLYKNEFPRIRMQLEKWYGTQLVPVEKIPIHLAGRLGEED